MGSLVLLEVVVGNEGCCGTSSGGNVPWYRIVGGWVDTWLKLDLMGFFWVQDRNSICILDWLLVGGGTDFMLIMAVQHGWKWYRQRR